MSLFVCCIAGALLGLVAWGCFWFASRPSIKQQHASSMGASQTASPTALQCPVAVTGMSIDPGPYAVGKVVHISLRINSTVSGLKIRLGFFAWAAAITPEQLSDPDNRKRLEESMWKQFEDKPPMPKIAVASVRGDVTGVLDWPIPTQEHADRLNGPDGVAYIMGQLDYGDGALDFGGYVRPSNEQMVTFAMEHNEPSPKRFFNSPAPLIESESATTSASPSPSPNPFPTLHDLYLNDFNRLLSSGRETVFESKAKPEEKVTMPFRVHMDFESKSKFLSVYIPHCQFSPTAPYDICKQLPDLSSVYLRDSEGVGVTMSDPGDASSAHSEDLVFTGKIFIYYEDEMTLDQLGSLEALFKSKNLLPQFRGTKYATTRWLQKEATAKQP